MCHTQDWAKILWKVHHYFIHLTMFSSINGHTCIFRSDQQRIYLFRPAWGNNSKMTNHSEPLQAHQGVLVIAGRTFLYVFMKCRVGGGGQLWIWMSCDQETQTSLCSITCRRTGHFTSRPSPIITGLHLLPIMMKIEEQEYCSQI